MTGSPGRHDDARDVDVGVMRLDRAPYARVQVVRQLLSARVESAGVLRSWTDRAFKSTHRRFGAAELSGRAWAGVAVSQVLVATTAVSLRRHRVSHYAGREHLPARDLDWLDKTTPTVDQNVQDTLS